MAKIREKNRGNKKSYSQKRPKFDHKGLGSQKKTLLQTFWITFHCKDAVILIYHARFCSKDLSDSIFVGLRIGLDAPEY